MKNGCKATCSSAKEYYARGPGGLEGAKEYFWFSKIAEGSNNAVADPDKVFADGKTYWMSGLFKWMVPFGGRPSPHSIITGQWRPTTPAESKIPPGFGAIVKLVAGDECGGNSNSPKGRMIRSVWQSLKTTFFKLSKSKMPGSTKEFDVSGGTFEKDDCAQADKGPFPKGSFGAFPIYLTPTYKDNAGTEQGKAKGKCFLTAVPTKFVVYQKDAYRRCAWENKKP